MSQVLRYGMPVSDGLRCENPACNELATFEVKLTRGRNEETTFQCNEHRPVIMADPNIKVLRFTKLVQPGSRNPDAQPKTGEKPGGLTDAVRK